MATDPQRGEIWLADLEPTRGSEMQKTRPVIVLSANSIRKLPVRIVVPLTGWKEHFLASPWKVRVEPDSRNNLSKSSAADCLQVRCLSIERFLERRGLLPGSLIDEMVDALNYCLEE